MIANAALVLIGARRITTFGETTSEESRIINAVYDDVRDEVLQEHPWGFAQKRATLVDMTRTAQDDWVTATVYAIDDIVLASTGLYYKCTTAHTSSALFSTDSAKWTLYLTWVTAIVYIKGDRVYNDGIEYACLVNHTSTTHAANLTSLYWVATELVEFDEDGMDYLYYLPTDYLKVNMLSARANWKMEGQRLLSDTGDLKIIYTYNLDTPSQYSPNFRMALATRLAAEICFNITQAQQKAADLLGKYEEIALPKAIGSDGQQGTPIEIQQNDWEDARDSNGTYLTHSTGVWHPA